MFVAMRDRLGLLAPMIIIALFGLWGCRNLFIRFGIEAGWPITYWLPVAVWLIPVLYGIGFNLFGSDPDVRSVLGICGLVLVVVGEIASFRVVGQAGLACALAALVPSPRIVVLAGALSWMPALEWFLLRLGVISLLDESRLLIACGSCLVYGLCRWRKSYDKATAV